MSSLDDCLREIARVPILLVASDYDGTISPIVNDPAQARPHRDAVVALRTLASLPRTHVAVISGRALAELAEMTGLAEDAHLVGSHGSEFDLDYEHELSQEVKTLRQRVALELEEIADAAEGLVVEAKPGSVALHYRNASPADADRAVAAAETGPASIDGVFTSYGKKVVELSVVESDKGAALDAIRRRCAASAVLFVGDDRTDEDAFARLCGRDLAVKVGPGESIAPHRVDGPDDVARLFTDLGERRAQWLADGV